MLAIFEAAHHALLERQQWPRNIVAGVIVGVMALPLAMASAIASGAKPEQGLYKPIAASRIVSLFGGSRVQIAGPTGAFVVILLQITNRYGMSGLQLATLTAGVILLLAGCFKFGAVIRFMPEPVIVGFTPVLAASSGWANGRISLDSQPLEGRIFMSACGTWSNCCPS